MNTTTIQDIKRNGASILKEDAPTYLIVNSKIKSVMVPPEIYEYMLEASEDLEDLRYIQKGVDLTELIDYEDLKKELNSEYVSSKVNKRGSKILKKK